MDKEKAVKELIDDLDLDWLEIDSKGGVDIHTGRTISLYEIRLLLMVAEKIGNNS